MTEQVNQPKTNGNGRNPLLFFGGLALLGIALALLLFGGSLFGGGETETAVLEQVPAFSQRDTQSGVAQLAPGSGPLSVGDRAYEFTATDLSGEDVALSDHLGQPVVLNFWATWCAPCRVEMPELQAAFEEYQEDGLVILALDNDETADTVRRFFYDELGLTFTPLLDENGSVAEQYGVVNFPSTFFVNPQGEITAIHRGPMTRSQIEGYLADTIPEKG